eukprot:4821463-Amphidinium_carterae.2
MPGGGGIQRSNCNLCVCVCCRKTCNPWPYADTQHDRQKSKQVQVIDGRPTNMHCTTRELRNKCVCAENQFVNFGQELASPLKEGSSWVIEMVGEVLQTEGQRCNNKCLLEGSFAHSCAMIVSHFARVPAGLGARI